MTLASAQSLTLLQARTEMSQRMQDEGTNPVWTAAQKTTKLQYWYTRWHDKFFTRLDRIAGTAGFTSVTVGLTLKDSVDSTVKVWRHIHREPSAGGANIIVGPEMEQMAPHRVRALQLLLPAQGPPTVVGVERKAANDASGTVGLWTLYPWPVPDATYHFSAVVERNAFYPVADADYLDCTFTEALIVVTLAAIEGATLGGRDMEFINGLWADVPKEVQDVMRNEMTATVLQSQYQAGVDAA